MTDIPRIFFDTNEGHPDSGYWLTLDPSLRDLAALGDRLSEGLEVIIRMPDELEMHATLRHDPDQGMWLADPIPGTIVYLDGSDG